MYPFDHLVRFQIVDCVSTQMDRTLFEETVHDIGDMCIARGAGLGRDKRVQSEPPEGSSRSALRARAASLYEIIRDDIISGRLKPNERLVVADLAERHGTSTNPVREALQLLRGEGFVVFVAQPRRARAADRPGFRPQHLRDRRADRASADPLVRRAWRPRGHRRARAIQGLIEANNFADPLLHSGLDTAFHTVMYQRHYNRHAAEIWWKHREVLRAVSRRFDYTLARRPR